LAALLAVLPQAGPARNFPRAAARLYLSIGTAPAVSLSGPAASPSAEEVNQAEQQLREVAQDPGASTREKALAAYVLGRGETAQGKTAAAQQDLARAAQWIPVRDAATADLVRLLAAAHDNAGVLSAAQLYTVRSDDPFAAVIGKTAARAAGAAKEWQEAGEWAGRFPDDPEMIWLQAQAADHQGDASTAARLERRLVYEYPASSEAKAAMPQWLDQLQRDPGLAADWKLTERQAAAWNAAGKYQEAADTWARAEGMAPAKERARLLGLETRAWLNAGHLITTATELKRLLHTSQRAEGLELEIELARRKGQSEDIAAPLAALGKEFAHSAWYARALHEAGNDAVLAGDDAAIEERFERLQRLFPRSSYGPSALWRAAWASFRQGAARTPALLEKYLRQYPQGPAAVDALYWRGVWAERHSDARLAQACFEAAATHFPGTYFGQQARKRVGRGAVPRARATWLEQFASHPATPEVTPIPAADADDVQRATWLQQAGLLDPAAAILAHVAYALPARASLTVARQLAEIDSERGAWSQGMTVMIRAVPNYMELQPNQLPQEDWQALFPAPFPQDLAAVAEHFGLDQNLLRGLIRQESGFNPTSLSRAYARGLMQLVLDTARGRLRQLPTEWQRLKGPGRLSADDLYNPALNVALGAAELQGLLQQFGQPAYALAGYNAGASRVQAWQQEFPGVSLDEFIESVPFSETRGYIQAVLRNATRYQEIYSHP